MNERYWSVEGPDGTVRYQHGVTAFLPDDARELSEKSYRLGKARNDAAYEETVRAAERRASQANREVI